MLMAVPAILFIFFITMSVIKPVFGKPTGEEPGQLSSGERGITMEHEGSGDSYLREVVEGYTLSVTRCSGEGAVAYALPPHCRGVAPEEDGAEGGTLYTPAELARGVFSQKEAFILQM